MTTCRGASGLPSASSRCWRISLPAGWRRSRPARVLPVAPRAWGREPGAAAAPSRWLWVSPPASSVAADHLPRPVSDVAADLRQVIRRLEAKSRASPAFRRSGSLEDLVGGAVEETDRGNVLCVRRRFADDHHHGRQPLERARGITEAPLALLARGQSPPGPRLLYLDTETTGLAGGTGTYVFLVGVGFFDDGAFEVRQYFMRDLDEEP